MSVVAGFDPHTRRTLEQYGFDEQAFSALRARVCDGSLSPQTNVVRGRVGPPAAEDIVALPTPGDPGHDEAHAAGLDALRAGAVASVVLNGGMATRFGGVVKGVVEAVDGRSFLEIKLGQAARLGELLGTRVYAAVMNSFATDAATRDFLAGRDVPEPDYFCQYVSLRLREDCGLFTDEAGPPSLYSPGHGDFLPVPADLEAARPAPRPIPRPAAAGLTAAAAGAGRGCPRSRP